MHAHWFMRISLAVLVAAGFRVQAETPIATSAELRITIYDEAHLEQEVLANALGGLRLILREAKIRSRTGLGDLAAPEASVFLPTRNDDHAAKPCGTRRDIALKIIKASPRNLCRSVLGMSSPFADFGLNVCVFDDHVREAARSHGESFETVLSFAMAHEIGHVLLRSAAHTSWGIMARVWTGFEYGEMARHGLLFDTEDARAMEANLSVPPCPASAPASVLREQLRSDEGTGSLTFPQAASGLLRQKVAASQTQNRLTDFTEHSPDKPKGKRKPR
jgi:hypothetical protein